MILKGQKLGQKFVYRILLKILSFIKFLHMMMKQSDVANFLDLIQHISSAKDYKSAFKQQKRKKMSRYDQSQYDTESIQAKRKNFRVSVHETPADRDQNKQSQFDHKMLKITHGVKRKPKSFKMQSQSEDKSQNLTQSQFGTKINKIRSNLYENYCQMIQKKRQQKISRMFIKSQNDFSHPEFNIPQVVQFDNNISSTKSRLTPFTKSKTMNPGLQLIKTKLAIQKQIENQGLKKSKKIIQPQQLNIQSMRGIKMPKINHSNGNIIQRKVRLKLFKNISPKNKNGPVSKQNNIDGWPMQKQQDANYFNIDYF